MLKDWNNRRRADKVIGTLQEAAGSLFYKGMIVLVFVAVIQKVWFTTLL